MEEDIPPQFLINQTVPYKRRWTMAPEQPARFSDWTFEVVSEDEPTKIVGTFHVVRDRLVECEYFRVHFSTYFQQNKDNISRLTLPAGTAEHFPRILDYLYDPRVLDNMDLMISRENFSSKEERDRLFTWPSYVSTVDSVVAMVQLSDYFGLVRLNAAAIRFIHANRAHIERFYLSAMESNVTNVLDLVAFMLLKGDSIWDKKCFYLKKLDDDMWRRLAEHAHSSGIAFNKEAIRDFTGAVRYNRLDLETFQKCTTPQVMPKVTCPSAALIFLQAGSDFGIMRKDGIPTNLQMRCYQSMEAHLMDVGDFWQLKSASKYGPSKKVTDLAAYILRIPDCAASFRPRFSKAYLKLDLRDKQLRIRAFRDSVSNKKDNKGPEVESSEEVLQLQADVRRAKDRLKEANYTVVVSGAGTAAVNGIYRWERHVDNWPEYTMESQHGEQIVRFAIVRQSILDGFNWEIRSLQEDQQTVGNGTTFYVAPSNKDSPCLPPLSKWEVVSGGQPPAPKVEEFGEKKSSLS